jgi:hypothetical protein
VAAIMILILGIDVKKPKGGSLNGLGVHNFKVLLFHSGLILRL